MSTKDFANQRTDKAKRVTFIRSQYPGYKALCKGCLSEPCLAYFLMIAVKDKRPLLTGEAALCLIGNLLRWQRETHFALLAFVVMPDHLHVLGILTSEQPLSSVV